MAAGKPLATTLAESLTIAALSAPRKTMIAKMAGNLLLGSKVAISKLRNLFVVGNRGGPLVSLKRTAPRSNISLGLEFEGSCLLPSRAQELRRFAKSLV